MVGVWKMMYVVRKGEGGHSLKTAVIKIEMCGSVRSELKVLLVREGKIDGKTSASNRTKGM